ncbi:MAG: NAD(+) diphosphatase, partial [Aeromonas veronii]
DDELVAADFFTADRLPRLPPHGTIARRLIELSLAGEG